MSKTFGPRPATAILLAIALHGLLAAGLLLAPQDPLPDDEVVLNVILTPPPRELSPPRALPAAPSTTPALHRSRDRRPQDAPAPPRAMADDGAWRVRPCGLPQSEGVSRSLRAGVGCQSADFLALTKAEQEDCNRKLAAGAQDGPSYAVISPKLKKQFDGVFECPKDDVWCEYRIGKGPYPGLLAPRKKKNPEWD